MFHKVKKIINRVKAKLDSQPFVASQVSIHGIDLVMLTPTADKTLGSWLRGEEPMCSLMLGELRLLLASVQPADNVLDAGANIGLYSILLAKKEPGCTIYAFEPDPVNYALLIINLYLNNVTNVVSYQAALGRENGHVSIYHNVRNIGDSRSFRPSKYDLGESDFYRFPQMMKMLKPQTLFSETDQQIMFDLVKIDTQGADFHILEAMVPLVRMGGKVVVEFSPYHLSQAGIAAEDIQRVIEYFSSVCRLSYGEDDLLSQISITTLISEFSQRSGKYEGYFDLLLTK